MPHKKIILITIFDNSNFGTYLQTLALSKVIEGMGGTVTIIDYWRPWLQYSKLLYPCGIRKWSANILKWIKLAGIIKARHSHHRFIKKHLSVTKRYYGYDALVTHPPKADIYLTGSDQVWNTTYNKGIDKAYYLGFVKEGKKCAYAASIGQDEIPSEYQSATKELLMSYSSISVREKQNVKLLNDIGISNIQVVLDPTLLFTKNDWKPYINKSLRPHRPYLLVYSVEKKTQSRQIASIAQNIAKQRGLKIISISYGGKGTRIPHCDHYHYYSTIERFLTLFYFADFIIVSSFHGTAFSINMNKEFITVAPNRFSNRVDNLLKITGLEERKTNSPEEALAISLNPIHYDLVNRLLDEQRVFSMDFIKNHILN